MKQITEQEYEALRRVAEAAKAWASIPAKQKQWKTSLVLVVEDRLVKAVVGLEQLKRSKR